MSLDDLIKLKIKRGLAFCDHSSFEAITNTRKTKYKLAGNYLEELRAGTFFVLTSKSSTCGSYLSVTINKTDWEYIASGHLNADCSYTSLNHFETLTDQDIKIKTIKKQFFEVAKLKENKIEEFKKRLERIQSVRRSDETKKIIVKSIADIGKAEELLQKFNLE